MRLWGIVFSLGSLGTVGRVEAASPVLRFLLAVQQEAGASQLEEGRSDDLRGHGVRGEIELCGSAHVCMANN